MFLLDPEIFPWDLAILLLLSFSLCGGILAFAYWRRSRPRGPRRLLLWVFWFLCLLCFSIVAYGSFFEPRLIVVTHASVNLHTVSPLRIAAIADFHAGPFKGETFIRRIVARVNQEHPDMIVLLGDFIADSTFSPQTLAPLKDLRAPLGVFAVMGNHDAGHHLSMLGNPIRTMDVRDDLQTLLQTLGVTVLRNASTTISLPGANTLAVAGVDEIWAGDADVPEALRAVPGSAVLILLSHNPDIILDPLSKRADLVIAGHTHGGQVRLPFLGPVPPIPDRLGRAFDQGLFSLDEDSVLAITRGVGETFARARLFAPPEILLLEHTGRNKDDDE